MEPEQLPRDGRVLRGKGEGTSEDVGGEDVGTVAVQPLEAFPERSDVEWTGVPVGQHDVLGHDATGSVVVEAARDRSVKRRRRVAPQRERDCERAIGLAAESIEQDLTRLGHAHW